LSRFGIMYCVVDSEIGGEPAVLDQVVQEQEEQMTTLWMPWAVCLVRRRAAYRCVVLFHSLCGICPQSRLIDARSNIELQSFEGTGCVKAGELASQADRRRPLWSHCNERTNPRRSDDPAAKLLWHLADRSSKEIFLNLYFNLVD